ncbi:hypothetical protein ACIPZF_12130 [Pseudomonas sp. NPDC089752]|uniref:hypothetical protein n=1 Tax=Pseudomonas sp. NPDC089752 TaxID=3364472 RepID=UPI0038083770
MAEIVLNTDVEAEIWRHACLRYPGQLAEILDHALGCFTRQPGLDDLTRLHHVILSDLGFERLAEALASHSWQAWHVRHYDHIELRWQLRMHLKRYLQARLIRDGVASSVIRDDHFAADLGL